MKQLLRTEQRLIKLSIPIIVVCCIIHIILLIAGIDEIFTEIFHETISAVMLMIAASVFHLCRLFKCLIAYKYAVEICVILQRNISIFGDYITPARWIMLLIGVALVSALWRRIGNGVSNR